MPLFSRLKVAEELSGGHDFLDEQESESEREEEKEYDCEREDTLVDF